MSITTESPVPFPSRRGSGRHRREQMQLDAVNAELQGALTREQALLKEKREQSQRQTMLAQEFEHRLVNGLQLVVSLLSMQSRAATTPEAAAQLTIASRRVSALGRVHHRLHLLDQQDRVEFKGYLQQLCQDLSGLLVDIDTGYAIAVEGDEIEIPTKSAIPLGFIVNELITNSVKYAKGRITVRIARTAAGSHSLSIIDEGPGLPADFDPSKSAGLGMKIVRSLIKQIDGELQFAPGDNGCGTRCIITFASI